MLLVLENEEGGSASEYGWSLEKKKNQARFSVKVVRKEQVAFSPAKHILNFNPQHFT